MAYRFPNYPPIETSADNTAQAHLDWLKDLIDMVEVLQWMLCRHIDGSDDYEDGVFAYGSTGNTSLKVVATSPASMRITVSAGAGFVDAVPFRKAAAETSAALVAPVSAPRIDIVAVDATTGTLVVLKGDEYETPEAPAHLMRDEYLKLGEIYHYVGETAIYDAATTGEGNIVDSRQILNP